MLHFMLILQTLNAELPKLGYNAMRLLTTTTDALKIEQLRKFAERVWPPEVVVPGAPTLKQK
jgi:hypothetical protein